MSKKSDIKASIFKMTTAVKKNKIDNICSKN